MDEERDMVDILDGFLKDAKYLITFGIGIMAIVFVMMTWIRTRSLAPTLGALLLGAVVIYGVTNFDFLSTQVQEDVNEHSK
jgi:hypothetical protein